MKKDERKHAEYCVCIVETNLYHALHHHNNNNKNHDQYANFFFCMTPNTHTHRESQTHIVDGFEMAKLWSR